MSERKLHRDLVTSLFDLNTCQIIAAAGARLLHTHFGAAHTDWTPTRLRGVLVFGRDREITVTDQDSSSSASSRVAVKGESYWFCLIDRAKRKVVWNLTVPEFPEYHVDRPFFHVLPSSSRLWGILFDNDPAAASFLEKVTRQRNRTQAVRPSPNAAQPFHSRPAPKRAVSKSSISRPEPESFRHVAHVGIDTRGAIKTSKGVDPSMLALIKELQGYGVTQDVVESNLDFIEGFLIGARSARSQGKHSPSSSESTTESAPVIPPPLQRRTSKQVRRKPVMRFSNASIEFDP